MVIKKTLSLIMSCLLILSTMVFTQSAVYANTNPTIASDYSEAAVAGETLRLPIYINDNSGLMGFRINVEYDSDDLTPVSVEYGDVCDSGLQDNIDGDAVDGSFKVYWSSTANNGKNGALFYINFNVASTASGNTTVNLSYSQEDTFDENYEDVVLNCQDVEINIINNNYSSYAKMTASTNDVAVGDNCVVILKLSELKALSTIQLTLTYPSDVFEFVSTECAANITSEKNNGNVVLNIDGIISAMNNTEFVTVKFKCKEQAVSGNYAFGLSSTTEGVFCKGCTVKVNPSISSDEAVIYTDKVTAKQNDVFDVPVKISNNHGIMGYMLHFEYNPTELEIVSVTSGTSFVGNFENNIGDKAGEFDALWTGSSAIAENGTILNLKLKVVTDQELSSTIKTSYSQDDTFNERYEDVVLICKEITVTLNKKVTPAQNEEPASDNQGETDPQANHSATKETADSTYTVEKTKTESKLKPKGTSIRKINSIKYGFQVKWKKSKNNVTGYQVQYSTKKNFKRKYSKILTVKGRKKSSKTVKKLKKNKKYYVRVRTYKTVNGKKYYSNWSKVKSVITK